MIHEHPEAAEYAAAAPELERAASNDLGAARKGRSVVWQCPLCEWKHERAETTVTDETLAGVFGYGVMRATAIHQENEKTEQLLRVHFATHRLEEWVAKISSLEAVIRSLQLTVLRQNENMCQLYDGGKLLTVQP